MIKSLEDPGQIVYTMNQRVRRYEDDYQKETQGRESGHVI